MIVFACIASRFPYENKYIVFIGTGVYHGDTSNSGVTMQEYEHKWECNKENLLSLFLLSSSLNIHTLKLRSAVQVVEAHNRYHSKPRQVEQKTPHLNESLHSTFQLHNEAVTMSEPSCHHHAFGPSDIF